MSKLEKTVKTAGVLGMFIAGAYVFDSVLPENYETEQRFGAEILYDRSGQVYVNSNPEHMMNYLLNNTDPNTLQHVLYKIGNGKNESR